MGKRISILLLVALLSIVTTTAQEFMMELHSNDSTTLIKISVVDDNPFYSGTTLIPEKDYSEEGLLWRILDSSGEEIGLNRGLEQNYFFYTADAVKVEILGDEEVIASQEFTLCDDDGVCEPCLEPGCDTVENFLTCPKDCPSGSEDGYCDMKMDDICDPDCFDREIDCEDCQPYCIHDEATCESLGGTRCGDNFDCIGGYFAEGLVEGFEVISDCCVIGECTPQYDPAQEYGDLAVEEAFFTEDEIEEMIEENESFDYGSVAGVDLEPSDVEEEEIYDEYEELLFEEDPNILLYASLGVAAALFIGLMLWLFHRKGNISKKSSEMLQQQIDRLVSQGNDYQQIKDMMIKKGIDENVVNQELRKDYEKRKDAKR